MNELITKLINLLELSDDDVLRALLSVYSPCQPGALRQSWNSRKNYGPLHHHLIYGQFMKNMILDV